MFPSARVVEGGADQVAPAADQVSTNADMDSTSADASRTSANLLASGFDIGSTEDDLVQARAVTLEASVAPPEEKVHMLQTSAGEVQLAARAGWSNLWVLPARTRRFEDLRD